MWQTLYQLLMCFGAIFMIMLVLVQRGRGGGLAGALGGTGGSSAFGAKAGDIFTKITIVTAILWVCFCALGIKLFGNHKEDASSLAGKQAGSTVSADPEPGAKKDNADSAVPKASSPTTEAPKGDNPADSSSK